MRIGVDISSLQGPHKMRGIGYVTRNFLKNIHNDASSNLFVFYSYESPEIDERYITELTSLEPDRYVIRHIKPYVHRYHINLPGKLRYIQKAFSKYKILLSYRNGSKKYGHVKDLDAFVQLDQNEPLARLRKGANNYFIAYDLIPYVLESDYLWSYHTARSNGTKILASFKKAMKRHIYIWKIRLSSKRAHKIISISKITKQDFEKYAKVPPSKIEVISLGVDDLFTNRKEVGSTGLVNRYYLTPWGYITKKESLKDQRFLLFVGGVDHRRKLNDLVTAFNHLRAQGDNIKLVLSGDIMLSPKAITTKTARKSLEASSYLDDIFFLGFTDDETRDWLYGSALAFVFPSIYEGFGLPVLEAMQHRTPVIAYNNKAIKEVAGDCPIYASGPLSIVDSVRSIDALDRKELLELTDNAFNHSSRYTWKKTTRSIISIISNRV